MFRRLLETALVVTALAAVGSTALAGVIVTETPQAQAFTATINASAVADPTLKACRELPALQKLEGRYAGWFTVAADPPTELGSQVDVDSPIAADPPSERYLLNFSLEALYDRAAGAGRAQGKWQLVDPSDGRTVVGSGELRAVVGAATPPDPEMPVDVSPPDPDLQLHGLLVGATTPPDPDLPALSLLADFSATVADGALNFTGSVGDPTVAGGAGALLPAVKC